MITLRFDGLFRGIPSNHCGRKAGVMCYGWLISRNGVLLARGHGAVARGKDATSNVAEYLALIEGLEALIDLGVSQETVKICGDSRCIIDQMRGAAAVNAPSMIPLHDKAARLVQHFRKLRWNWMPRKHNKEADSLTRRALRQVRLDPNVYQKAVAAIVTLNKPRRSSNRFLPLMDLRVYQPVNEIS
jgi:ribonuclease HI